MTYRLDPYDPAWPEAFTRQRDAIANAFGDTRVRIEHIGSTSVPGLCAKPILDLLLGADSLAAIEARIPALAAIGYGYVPDHEDVLPMRRYFVRPAGAHLRVHLHGVVEASAIWNEHLLFRDVLRRDARIREAYAQRKRELFAQHPDDRSAYTAAKAPFIRSLLDAALGSGRGVRS